MRIRVYSPIRRCKTYILTHLGPVRVSTDFSRVDIDSLARSLLDEHYETCLDTIESRLGVWCERSDDASPGEAPGEEVWYPRFAAVQPTHWLIRAGDPPRRAVRVERDGSVYLRNAPEPSLILSDDGSIVGLNGTPLTCYELVPLRAVRTR